MEVIVVPSRNARITSIIFCEIEFTTKYLHSEERINEAKQKQEHCQIYKRVHALHQNANNSLHALHTPEQPRDSEHPESPEYPNNSESADGASAAARDKDNLYYGKQDDTAVQIVHFVTTVLQNAEAHELAKKFKDECPCEDIIEEGIHVGS